MRLGLAMALSIGMGAGSVHAASSALTTHNGARNSPITTGLLATYLDHFIPGDSKKLLVFSQCFGGGFAQGGFFDDPNTAVAAGAAADQYGIYGGYHDDAARALRPGGLQTGATVHQAGMDGRIEDPDYPESSNVGGGLPLAQFSLEPVTGDGAVRSRHILVYAGIPQIKNIFDPKTNQPLTDPATGERLRSGDSLDRDAIRMAFQDEARTSVTAVGGEPPEGSPNVGQDGWDFPADSNGLTLALQKIRGEIIGSGNPVSTEQFILFVGDHGTRLGTGDDGFGFPKDCLPSGARCELITLPGIGAAGALAGFVDPLSRPGFEVVLPYDGMSVPLVFDAQGGYVPFNAPGTFTLEVTVPGGSPFVLEAFDERYAEIDDGVLGNLPGEGLSLFFPVPRVMFFGEFVDTPLALTLVNHATFPVRVGDAWQTTGPVARGPSGCATIPGCRSQLALVLPPTAVDDRKFRRTARQLGAIGGRIDALLGQIEGATGKRRTRLARRAGRLGTRLVAKGTAAARRGRLGTPLAALQVVAAGIAQTLAVADPGPVTTTTVVTSTTTTTTLQSGRALVAGGGPGVCLARITGGCVAGAHVPFCAYIHLHLSLQIDGGAPIPDPESNGCGHGEVSVVAGCGPDAVPDCN